jgi:hypothetical protein
MHAQANPCRRPLLLTTAHPLLTFASPLLTSAHPVLPIKQPCSPFRTETDFVQVRIQVKQPAVISDLASGTARNPPLMAVTIIINELFL